MALNGFIDPMNAYMNRHQNVQFHYVDLTVAYYDFRCEIIVLGLLDKVGFYTSRTRFAGKPENAGSSQCVLFECLDDFMSGWEPCINKRKRMIDWCKRRGKFSCLTS